MSLGPAKQQEKTPDKQDDLLRKTTDLHATHEIAIQLEKSKKSTENLVYHLPELIFIVDKQSRILKGNKSAEKVFQVDRNCLINKNLSHLFSEETWSLFWEKVQKLDQSDLKTSACEFDLPTDGVNITVRHIHWNIRIVQGLSDRRGLLYYVVGLDITDIRLMFDEIQKSNKQLVERSQELENLLETANAQEIQLVHATKLAQLGEMAGGIAHEINNPITIIKGHAEHLEHMIKQGHAKESVIQRSTDIITATVARIEAIVNSMRSLSQDGSADPFEKADLAAIAQDSLTFFRQKFKHNLIEVRDHTKDLQVIVECRNIQISQIFINLIGNACDSISATKNSWIEIDIKETEEKASIRITDSGPRVSDKILEKMMQPFFTTKPVGSGTGLGLSIARSIANQHGGELRPDKNHENMSFIIDLPKYHNSN